MRNLEHYYRIIKESPDIALGAMDLVIGEHIASGTYRDVYAHATNPDWVVKVQRDNGYFSNVLEFEIWSLIAESKKDRKWFAPIHYMSENGKVMIQQRIRPLVDNDVIPDKIPAYFTDIKRENFGFIGKQLVCCDYDYSLIRFICLTTDQNKKRSSKKLKVKK